MLSCVRRLLAHCLLALLEPDIRRMIHDEIPPDLPDLDYDVQPLFHEGPGRDAA